MVYFITRQLKIESHPDIQLATLDEMFQYFEDKDEVQIDTETEGFFNHSNRIISLQLGTIENQFVIDFQYLSENEKDRISKEILNNPSKLKILHNAKFDIQFIWFEGMEICCVYDTMLSECILNAGKELPPGSNTLKEVCLKYCEVELDKEIRGIIHREGLSDRVVLYAAEDVKYLSSVKKVQHKELIERGEATEDTQDIESVLGLENNAVFAFAKIEYNGIKLDINKLEEVRNYIQIERNKILHDLDTEVINNPKLTSFWIIYHDLFTPPEKRLNINWNSSQQKLNLLQKVENNIKTTNQSELEKYKNKHEIINLLIKYSKINKLLTSFANKLHTFINPYTKRIHADFWQILDTGRVSCRNPNLQQIPARTEIGNKLRNCFICEPGMKMVGGDYSGCELRVIAEYSKDPIWLEAFLNNEDLHSKLCALTFNIPIEDVKNPSHFKPDLKYRDIQKTINFGLAYGMSEYKLASIIEIEVDEARKIITKFFKTVPAVKTFLEMLGKTSLTQGKIRTPPPYRRIRWFDDYQSNDKKKLGEIERAGKNHPIQGCNADLTKLALVMLYREIQENNLPVRLIHTIHDEIQTEVPEAYAETWAKRMGEIMEECGKVVVKTIPMKVDCKITDMWTK